MFRHIKRECAKSSAEMEEIMRVKKLAAIGLSVVCALGVMTGCGTADKSAAGSSGKMPITVISREEGSGTRGAFVELFGIEEENADGEKVDMTTVDAAISNSTEAIMTTVADDEYAIGYTSLGALNSTVKALKIDGAEATAENIKNGSYKIQRPFNIATKGEVSDLAQDFIQFILSEDGQKVVEANGYIAIENQGKFTSNNAVGKLVIAGSSSVSPVMVKLTEAYNAINAGAEIEVQESDSTTGMTSAAEGTCDIGMASRELKDTEAEAGLVSTAIAFDGIAVIVNNENAVEDITPDMVKEIFKGEVTDWNDVAK